MSFDNSILHELFADSKTITVLGHLVITAPFEFSFDELAEIDGLTPLDLRPRLENLVGFGLVDYKNGKYSFGESDLAVQFNKFVTKLLVFNVERLGK